MNTSGTADQLVQALKSLHAGDLKWRMPEDGEIKELGREHNGYLDQMQAAHSEQLRIASEIAGGILGGQIEVHGLQGAWREQIDHWNQAAAQLTDQFRDIGAVINAVGRGDLSKKVTAPCGGELLEVKHLINVMNDNLLALASEAVRVLREIGHDGILGGQANVPGAEGTWKDIVDSVNATAATVTYQVRDITSVTHAVARGDLTKKITAPARGEVLELKNEVNVMVDQLNRFASEVTRVSREMESGIFGGQADIPGLQGTWKDLIHTINSAAATLTVQIRSVSETVDKLLKNPRETPTDFDCKGEMNELKQLVNQVAARLPS